MTAPGDAAALAEAINGLLQHPDEARRLAERGEREARQRFGLEACVTRVNELIAAAVLTK